MIGQRIGPLTPSQPIRSNVSGGVTFQIKADCGANTGCMVDLYIDNVSVTTECRPLFPKIDKEFDR